MKKIAIILILAIAATPAFGLNPASVNIKVTINKNPGIDSFVPADGLMINKGDTLTISVTASDPNNDVLEYRFLVNGSIKQDWSTASSISYVLDETDIGLNKIQANVKDALVTVSTDEIEIYVCRSTVALPQ